MYFLKNSISAEYDIHCSSNNLILVNFIHTKFLHTDQRGRQNKDILSTSG